ncbi:hypothetical protein CANCADRAFT_25702 [Tortispora caseinolytica NRRL Y-17796]|uniref:Mitochondrial ornithine carrier protein n=1 Tax=Tortispora caseinolytica NRRL Y-17796 TaxID=767744 RepID=A0A1E4TGV2_9ASCO|nr:hypothetical protein CANCADRAFT_25702 [Tortispora caseinolytica NRRL Y-17796]
MTNDAVKDIVCGSIAGMSGKVIEYPFDTVKVRLQSLGNMFSGPLDCFKRTIKNEGFLGLYRGMSSPIIGAGVENAALFVSYSAAKSVISGFTEIGTPQLVVCGAFAGVFTSFFITPIELVKCKMQGRRSLHTQAAVVPGPLEIMKAIYYETGIKGFWRGQMGTLFRECGGSAAWFGAYEYTISLLSKDKAKPSTSDSMIAGAAAGIGYNISLFPADSVKSKMQTDTLASDKPFFRVLKEMYQTGGVRSLYRGCGITVLRAAPSSAIIFSVYESLKGLSL